MESLVPWLLGFVVGQTFLAGSIIASLLARAKRSEQDIRDLRDWKHDHMVPRFDEVRLDIRRIKDKLGMNGDR